METLSKPRAGSRRKILQDKSPKEVKGSNAVDADTLLVYLGQIQKEEANVKAAKQRLNKVWKLAINAGIVRKDLELVLKFADMDPDTVLGTIARIKDYAQWLEIPIGKQLSLFEIPSSSILSQDELGERAYRAGYVLGVQAKDPDEQAYPPLTDLGQKHMEGYNAGQKVHLDRIQPITIAMDAAEIATKAEPEPAPAEAEARELEDA